MDSYTEASVERQCMIWIRRVYDLNQEGAWSELMGILSARCSAKPARILHVSLWVGRCPCLPFKYTLSILKMCLSEVNNVYLKGVCLKNIEYMSEMKVLWPLLREHLNSLVCFHEECWKKIMGTVLSLGFSSIPKFKIWGLCLPTHTSVDFFA